MAPVDTRATTRRRRRSGRSGYTLIELMVALVVLSLGLFSILQLQVYTVRGHAYAREKLEALRIAQGVAEELRTRSLECSDIIDHVRARRNSCAHDFRLTGIDGNRNGAFPPDRPNHRNHPIELLIDSHRLRSGARRFPTDVDDVRTLVLHPQRMVDRLFEPIKPAAIRKRIGRDIQYAHHDRTRQVEMVAADG